jgi:hypothetical protein
MMSTFEQTRDTLLKAIESKRSVIALSGRWGTGKTHLWKTIAETHFSKSGGAPGKSRPIYVSIFGATSITDVKMRIFQNAYLSDKDSVQKLFISTGTALKGAAQRFFGISTDELSIAWLPELISDRIIVLDDIERKHRSLDIEAILGFLDEFSQAHDTQFLLLLNNDELGAEEEKWATLHEKVIDVEVVFSPTPADSFAVAAADAKHSFADEVREAVVAMGVTNIRIIRQIIGTVDAIATAGHGLALQAADVIPTASLLTAIRYRALKNGPSMDYVCTYVPVDRRAKAHGTPVNQVAWDALLERLGVRTCGPYELLVRQFLESGILDMEALRQQCKIFQSKATSQEGMVRLATFFDSVRWDPSKSKEVLLAECATLLPSMSVVGPVEVSALARLAGELGDSALAQKLVDKWKASADTREEFRTLKRDQADAWRDQLHPQVFQLLWELAVRNFPPKSLVEVIQSVSRSEEWSERDWSVLRSSRVADYEAVLTSQRGVALRQFVAVHISWAAQRPEDSLLKRSTEHFLTAAENLINASPSGRLASILQRELDSIGHKGRSPVPAK